MSDDFYIQLMDIIGQLTTLEKLELKDCSCPTFRADECLLPMLSKKLTNLKEFSIDGFDLLPDALLEFLEATPQLTDFKFINCGLSFDDELLTDIVRLRRKQALQLGIDVLPLRIFEEGIQSKIRKFDDILTVHEFEEIIKFSDC